MLLSPLISPSPFPRALVHKTIFYACISIAALQIGSSVPSFYISNICVNIWYLFFSFWLTSLHMIGFRFLPLTRTDSSVQIKIVGVGVLLPPFDWRVPEQSPWTFLITVHKSFMGLSSPRQVHQERSEEGLGSAPAQVSGTRIPVSLEAEHPSHLAAELLHFRGSPLNLSCGSFD